MTIFYPLWLDFTLLAIATLTFIAMNYFYSPKYVIFLNEYRETEHKKISKQFYKQFLNAKIFSQIHQQIHEVDHKIEKCLSYLKNFKTWLLVFLYTMTTDITLHFLQYTDISSNVNFRNVMIIALLVSSISFFVYGFQLVKAEFTLKEEGLVKKLISKFNKN